MCPSYKKCSVEPLWSSLTSDPQTRGHFCFLTLENKHITTSVTVYALILLP